MALQTGQATETRAMHPNYTPAALELTGERNPRGIPAVKFIEDVEAHLVALYCKGGTIDDLTDEKVAECVGVMQELYSKYKFMEQHLVKNKVNYRNKLPELKKFAERNKERGVLVAEVIIDKEPEQVELMRKLTVDELALPFPVIHDRFGIVSRRYGALELPYMVVLDGDRIVRWVHTGFTPDAMKQLQQAVDGVLATATPVKSDGTKATQ